jgi:hypothetical protein
MYFLPASPRKRRFSAVLSLAALAATFGTAARAENAPAKAEYQIKIERQALCFTPAAFEDWLRQPGGAPGAPLTGLAKLKATLAKTGDAKEWTRMIATPHFLTQEETAAVAKECFGGFKIKGILGLTGPTMTLRSGQEGQMEQGWALLYLTEIAGPFPITQPDPEDDSKMIHLTTPSTPATFERKQLGLFLHFLATVQGEEIALKAEPSYVELVGWCWGKPGTNNVDKKVMLWTRPPEQGLQMEAFKGNTHCLNTKTGVWEKDYADADIYAAVFGKSVHLPLAQDGVFGPIFQTGGVRMEEPVTLKSGQTLALAYRLLSPRAAMQGQHVNTLFRPWTPEQTREAEAFQERSRKESLERLKKEDPETWAQETAKRARFTHGPYTGGWSRIPEAGDIQAATLDFNADPDSDQQRIHVVFITPRLVTERCR